MLKRYDNTIYKLFLRSKKIIKAILNSMTRIRLIIYIENPEEASGVDHVHIKEDTNVEEITVADTSGKNLPAFSQHLAASSGQMRISRIATYSV